MNGSKMKKVIIIGAGISGLSSGIYARINGLATEIYEMNFIPGGECTGWDRKGYHFDGCIHYLYGSKKGSPLNQLWNDVGALNEQTKIVNTDFFFQFEDMGKTISIYKDVDILEKHLLEISHEDSQLISDICHAIRMLHKMDPPVDKPMDMLPLKDTIKMIVKMLPLQALFKRYGSISIMEMAEQFKNPLIRKALQLFIPSKNNALTFLNVLASMNVGDCGWPVGGSKQFASRMEKKYKSLGGKIHYKSPVERIKIENGKAIGIVLKNGEERLGDYIISSADGYFTLNSLLLGKYWDKKLIKLYSDDASYPTMTTVQVSVGINSDLSGQPDMLYFKPSNRIDAGGFLHNYIGLKHFSYDKTIAPEGKSVVTVLLEADFNWWSSKYENKVLYNLEKKRIAKEVASAIEERYSETRSKIEIVDVATPMTYVRYCNAWRGAWMSWMMTPKIKIRYHSGKLKGLNNFYLTGQWTMPPGGLPGAVMTGKWTIQRICKDYKIKFQSHL
jgi:phytoene dehydrogenase-like protein